jgi:hypothetical protein
MISPVTGDDIRNALNTFLLLLLLLLIECYYNLTHIALRLEITERVHGQDDLMLSNAC